MCFLSRRCNLFHAQFSSKMCSPLTLMDNKKALKKFFLDALTCLVQ